MPQRGTDVILHLRDGEEEFLRPWKLKSIISRYSDHISLPILMRKETWDEEKKEQVPSDEWETVNKAAALWTRPKSDVTDAQYQEFYKQIAFDSEPPLAYTHNRVEGRSEYTQLLYIPAKAPFDLWNRDKRGGVKLYVKRVFIMDDADALMPVYLRFVKGVVDSSDLPLNVSRELLQESRDVKAIREGCTKRVLSMLESLADSESADDKAKYQRFWNQFGAVIKEGVGEDHANSERLAKLLRFASTHADEGVSLADYVKRMKEGQQPIYCITADSLSAAKSSPQLEIFRKKGVEVLLLVDRVDEWMLSHLYEYEGHSLQSVAKGAVDLGQLQDEEEKKQADAAAEQCKPLLERAEGHAEGSRQGRARDHAAGRFTGLPGRGGRRHERAPGAAAQAGGPGRTEDPADPRDQSAACADPAPAKRRGAVRRPGAHRVRPGLAGRRRPARRSGRLRAARDSIVVGPAGLSARRLQRQRLRLHRLDLLAQLLRLLRPVVGAAEPRKGGREGRVGPAIGQPGAVVQHAQRAQRLDQRQLAGDRSA